VDSIKEAKNRNFLDIVSPDFEISRGGPLPLGATPKRGGINFAVYSKNATSVSLVLFILIVLIDNRISTGKFIASIHPEYWLTHTPEPYRAAKYGEKSTLNPVTASIGSTIRLLPTIPLTGVLISL